MRNAIKQARGKLNSLLKKPKQTVSAPPARVRRTPSPQETVMQQYAGPAPLVGAAVAWGPGRLAPQMGDLEAKSAEYFEIDSDQILCVAGSAAGGPAASVSQHVACFVHGYDWREGAEASAQSFVKSAASPKTLVRQFCLDSVFPPFRRFHALLAVEPILTLSHQNTLDWMRMGLHSEAQIVLEEPSMEAGHGMEPSSPWFNAERDRKQTWMGPGEREAALNRAGFKVAWVRESTGRTVRSLRMALEASQARGEELRKAMEIAPVLEDVLKSFKEEVVMAKNRLHALETGEIAVYRYHAFKQRAER